MHFVGKKIVAVTMENSTGFPQKIKNRGTISFGNSKRPKQLSVNCTLSTIGKVLRY